MMGVETNLLLSKGREWGYFPLHRIYQALECEEYKTKRSKRFLCIRNAEYSMQNALPHSFDWNIWFQTYNSDAH